MTSRIKLLPENVINRIAAGEVVERPASILKELLENSLDSGARRVDIECEKGGKTLIQIKDDGCGMNEEELRIALERHATSKLSADSDLSEIHTLGFRGEALPSIASVSKVSITSSTGESEGGHRILIEGGKILGMAPVPANKGTTVMVRDIFFNVPARLKFLKTTATEEAHLVDAVQRYALSRPELSVRLICDGREMVFADSHNDFEARLYKILGPAAKTLIPFSSDTGDLKITGYLGAPDGASRASTSLYVYVLGRPVKDRLLLRAVTQGYGRTLPQGRYPVGLVFIDIIPNLVDVNVHPAKTEVRFQNSGRVFGLVSKAVSRVITASPISRLAGFTNHGAEGETEDKASPDSPASPGLPAFPAFPASPSFTSYLKPPSSPAEEGDIYKSVLKTLKDTIAPGGFPPGAHSGKVPAASPKGSPFPEEDSEGFPSRKGSPEASPEEPEDGEIPQSFKDRVSPFGSSGPPGSMRTLGFGSGTQGSSPLSSEDALQSPERDGFFLDSDPEPNPEDEPDAPPEETLTPLFKEEPAFPRPLAQLVKTYILAASGEGLVIVDQHAAHERILFNRLRKDLMEGGILSRNLLFPETFDLSSHAKVAADKLKDELSRIGFAFEHFGGSTFILKGVPALLDQDKAREALLEILNGAQGNLAELDGGGLSDALEEVSESWLHSVACRAAIKAGHTLSLEEMEALLKDMAEAESGGYCPHGRPSSITMTYYELEKKFGRK